MAGARLAAVASRSVKLKVIVIVVLAALVGLLINAVAVDRAARAAEPFGGGRVLELSGPDLNVREYGPPGDRAVVLLHGYSASIEWWQGVAERLAADGRRVVAVDLVGHGGSEAPRDVEQYGAGGQATAVRQALSVLGIRHAVLIGHSMGGGVATAVAEADPGLVEKVVVSDTPGDDGLVTMPLLGKAVCWPLLGQLLDRFRAIPAVNRTSLQTGFSADYPVPDFAYRSLARLTHTGVCDSDVIDELDADRAVADRLAGLGKPVLVLWGDRDVLVPTAANVARYTEAGLPPRLIAGSGHSPMVQKPDEFVSAVREFVAEPVS